MKQIFLLLLIISLVTACAPASQKVTPEEKHDINTLDSVLTELRQDPDATVSRCNEFLTTNGKSICYTAYVELKAGRNETVDSSICQFILKDDAKGFCLERSS